MPDAPIDPRSSIDVAALVASLGHELRTPINAILGYCELMSHELSDAGHAELLGDLRRVRQCGEHMAALMDALVDLARIERGQASMAPALVELEPVVTEALAPLRPPRRVGGPPVEVSARGDLGLVRVDAGRLGRAVLAVVRSIADQGSARRVTVQIARCQDGVSITAQAAAAPGAEGVPRLAREGHGGVLIARAFCAAMGVSLAVEDEARIVLTIPSRAEVAPAPLSDP